MFSSALLAIVLLGGGCERAASRAATSSKSPYQRAEVKSPNQRAEVSKLPQPVKQTPEMAEVDRMREALDSGDTRRALAVARGLVDSKDQKILLQVIEVLEWIGKPSIPELTELADSRDEIVAEAALQSWDRVLDGIQDQSTRLAIIMRTARCLSRENLIDAVFLKLVDCDRVAALVSLVTFIGTTSGLTANRCAKEIYAHLASEQWESAARAEILIKELKSKEGT